MNVKMRWSLSFAVLCFACEGASSSTTDPAEAVDAAPGDAGGAGGEMASEPDAAPAVEPDAAPAVEPDAAPAVEPDAAPAVEPDAAMAPACPPEEADAVQRRMVEAPIVPGQSLGTVPLLGPDGLPALVDALLANPAYCGGDLYEDAVTWAPRMEVVLTFDPETRSVLKLLASGDYAGALEGSYTATAADATSRAVPVRLVLRSPGTVDGVPVAGDPAERAWGSEGNVSALYRMVAESFFDAEPFAEDFNCVTAGRCTVDSPDAGLTVVEFAEFGVQVLYNAEGTVTAIGLTPVVAEP